MARYSIYTEDGKIIESVFMVILNGTIYVCYQHFSSDKIRCYRSYNSAGDFNVAWTLSGTDSNDIDWIEILSMRDKQLFGMKKQRTDRRGLDQLERSMAEANSQLMKWGECRL